jgi:predicted TPR repeat methyltransferase
VVFTLERAEDDVRDRGFLLNVHGRYSHAEASVRRTLAEAGFTDVAVATDILRKERLEEVVGLIVSARREESSAV